VGGKNASLGEMRRELTKQGVSVPNGFAVTVNAYHDYIDAGILQEWHESKCELDVRQNIRKILSDFDAENMDVLSEREVAFAGSFTALNSPGRSLKRSSRPTVASAKSMGGYGCGGPQQRNCGRFAQCELRGPAGILSQCPGEYALVQACKRFCFHLHKSCDLLPVHRGFDHFDVALSIGVQKMVRSDKACSGVMFTMDTESGFPHVVYITGAYGLGENIVQGVINPDEFYVFKPCLRGNYKPSFRRPRKQRDQDDLYHRRRGFDQEMFPSPPTRGLILS